VARTTGRGCLLLGRCLGRKRASAFSLGLVPVVVGMGIPESMIVVTGNFNLEVQSVVAHVRLGCRGGGSSVVVKDGWRLEVRHDEQV
jgi:hypothetical protein